MVLCRSKVDRSRVTGRESRRAGCSSPRSWWRRCSVCINNDGPTSPNPVHKPPRSINNLRSFATVLCRLSGSWARWIMAMNERFNRVRTITLAQPQWNFVLGLHIWISEQAGTCLVLARYLCQRYRLSSIAFYRMRGSWPKLLGPSWFWQ